jgi:hypothetical protein
MLRFFIFRVTISKKGGFQMRSTTVTGINDNFYLNLGSDTSIIGEVIERGRCVDYLIYELELNGEELLAFLAEFHIEIDNEIKVFAENKYILKSYDW